MESDPKRRDFAVYVAKEFTKQMVAQFGKFNKKYTDKIDMRFKSNFTDIEQKIEDRMANLLKEFRLEEAKILDSASAEHEDIKQKMKRPAKVVKKTTALGKSQQQYFKELWPMHGCRISELSSTY